MTVIAAFIDSEGAGFVSDMRLLGDCSIMSDSFCKLWQLANDTLTVSVSGEIGPAQKWFREAEREGVSDLGDLMACQVPGDYNFLVYDAVSHALFSGDASGCLVPITSWAVHGIGEEFVRGYVTGRGFPDSRPAKLTRLSAAIAACSRLNVAVSREVDMVYVTRMTAPARKRREKQLPRNARQAA